MAIFEALLSEFSYSPQLKQAAMPKDGWCISNFFAVTSYFCKTHIGAFFVVEMNFEAINSEAIQMIVIISYNFRVG